MLWIPSGLPSPEYYGGLFIYFFVVLYFSIKGNNRPLFIFSSNP